MNTSFGSVVPSTNFNFFKGHGNNDNTSANSTVNNSNFFLNSNETKPSKNVFMVHSTSQKKSQQPLQNLSHSPSYTENKPDKKKKYMINDAKTIQLVGPLISSPDNLGFQKRSHKARELPRFLINQEPQLEKRAFVQDPWDKANQEKMISLEESIDDLNELYETLKKNEKY